MSSSHLRDGPSPDDSLKFNSPYAIASNANSLRHPPMPTSTEAAEQPRLIRTSLLPNVSPGSPQPQRVDLQFVGDLLNLASDWDQTEYAARRRLVRFNRRQVGHVVRISFEPITPQQYRSEDMVISCIFREDAQECFITSVDAIYLLEGFVGVCFSVEEKNRIRRNLEGFKPLTVSKTKADSEAFFKLLMSFPNPKPRNIEKDVKVFPWKVLSKALQKILGKYSAVTDEMVQQNSIMVPEQVYSSVPKSPLSPSAPPVADPRFSPMPSGRSLQILDTASSSYSHLSSPPNSASPYSYNSHPFGYSMQNDQSLGAVSRLDVADSPSVFPERHHRSFSTASSSVSDYPGPASYDFGPAYVPSTTGNPPMLPLPRVNSFPQANAPAQIPPMPYSGQTGYYYPYSPHPQAFPRQSSENIA